MKKMGHCYPSARAALLASCVGSLLSVAAHASDPTIKVNGFVDAQIQKNSAEDITRGFMVNDGALYLTEDSQNVDFKVDLPFRMITRGNPNFEFATTKAQAYVGYKYENGFRWKIGQFDTPCGFEGNDTADIVFTRQGNLYSYMVPTVHTGALLSYDANKEVSLNFFANSPNDTGAMSGGKNIQFGAHVIYSGAARFSAAFLANKESVNNRFNSMVDATAGITIGSLSLDGEVNSGKKQSEVRPDNGGPLPAGFGVLFQPVYSMNDDLSLGARGEYITNFAKRDPRQDSSTLPFIEKQFLLFVGPQYQMAANLKLKLDYSFQSDEAFGGTKQSTHGIQFAAVKRF